MSKEKQTSDAMNNSKDAGTTYTTLTPRPFAAGSGAVESGAISPSGNTTSGTSQSDKRGPQGMGK